MDEYTALTIIASVVSISVAVVRCCYWRSQKGTPPVKKKEGRWDDE